MPPSEFKEVPIQERKLLFEAVKTAKDLERETRVIRAVEEAEEEATDELFDIAFEYLRGELPTLKEKDPKWKELEEEMGKLDIAKAERTDREARVAENMKGKGVWNT
jgi:hypothetical protein